MTVAGAADSASQQITARQIFCVNAHAYQDRGVADDVVAGRFTHCGVTLDLGLDVDWMSDPYPADIEWQIDWNKFYFGRNLAAAFRDTGDLRYLRAWERLLTSWIVQVPLDRDISDSHVPARRIQNWVYAWAEFAAAPAFAGLGPGVDRRIGQSIAEQAQHIREHLTPGRNHRTIELYALFCVALALPDIDPDGELLRFSLGELSTNLLTDIRPDGVHFEQSTHYHLVVLRSFLGLRENARRFGLELPEGFDERLGRACDFAMHCHRPDGRIPASSDADEGTYLDLLALAADLLGRPDLRYVATAGEEGTRPRRRYAGFPDGGYYVQRSGWGGPERAFADERFLLFDCGPLGAGGHGHYDALSLEAYADGAPLAIDPGRYTYSEHEDDPSGVARNLRHWFKGTAGHNTVRVDGRDQTPYHRGKPRTAVAEARLLGRWSAQGLDVLRGEVHSPCYEVVHRRRVAFVADEFWLIEDELDAREPHHYEQRFHLAPQAHDRVTLERGVASVVRAPGLALVLDPGLEVVLEPGWFAPLYGVREPAPVVMGACSAAGPTRLLTVLAPLADDRPSPVVRLRRDAGATIVEVRGAAGGDPGVRDVVAWSDTGRPFALDGQVCDAPAVWTRRSATGELLTVRAAEAVA